MVDITRKKKNYLFFFSKDTGGILVLRWAPRLSRVYAIMGAPSLHGPAQDG